MNGGHSISEADHGTGLVKRERFSWWGALTSPPVANLIIFVLVCIVVLFWALLTGRCSPSEDTRKEPTRSSTAAFSDTGKPGR